MGKSSQLLTLPGEKMFLSKNKSIIILFLTAILLTGCAKKEAETTTDKTTYTDTVSVEISRAAINDINVVKTFSANIEGEEQANLYSKIPERITEVKVKVGDYVSKGQLLIGIEKSGASSQFYQAQAAFLNAKRDLDRMKSLYDAGAISKQMLDGIQTQYEVSKANFDAAKSTVELTAPLSGVVTAINVNTGDLATPGIVLATIAQINRMKAIFNVGESDVPGFSVGQKAEIYSEMKPDLVQTGKISQISKSAQVASRTFEMRATFDNTKDKFFKPGMFCKVNVILKTQKGSVTVPNSALVTTNNNTGIYVVQDGKSIFRDVKTGLNDGKNIEILSGIKEGDVVVTVGQNEIKEGTVVKIQNL